MSRRLWSFRRRRRSRRIYSLRTLLLLVMLIAATCAAAYNWQISPAHQQRLAVAAILRAGGEVTFTSDHYLGPNFDPRADADDEFWMELWGEGSASPVHTVAFYEQRKFEQASSGRAQSPPIAFNGDEVLRQAATIPTIRKISAHGDSITDAGLLHLDDLVLLRSLDLSETRITDAGLKFLSNLQSLEWLDLRGTHITDAGLQHLASIATLRTVRLQITNLDDGKSPAAAAKSQGITMRGIDQLRKLRPALLFR